MGQTLGVTSLPLPASNTTIPTGAWRPAPELGSTDYIDASWSFGTGPGGNFACEFIQGLVDALGVIAPEFAVQDIELGEAIGVACTAAMDHAGKG